MEPQSGDKSLSGVLSNVLRTYVEEHVSKYLRSTWHIARIEDKSESASHPAGLLVGEGYSVFVKLGETIRARDEFDRELAGLRLLTTRSGVLTPQVIGNLEIEGGSLMVLEALEVVHREPSHWRQIGHALARVHQAKWDRCGLDAHCYWGSLYQDNSPTADWPEFFRDRRLLPRLKAAADSGYLPADLASQVEQVGSRISQLCGPAIEPSLLHGDAHQNNFLTTARGPAMIDPSVHYGHPELDLAYVDFFTPVPDDLFRGYQDMTALDPDFAARRDLWRLPGYLAMVEVDGSQHVERLAVALRQYL